MNDLFKQLSTGVYVVAVSDGEHENAFTAAWVMQVSFKPPLLAISINPEHYSCTLLKKGGVCTVNVLARHQLAVAEHFGQSVKDKLSGFAWQYGQTAAPYLAESLAYFDCKVSHYAEAGDHQLAICTVLGGAILQTGTPLLYAQTDNMDNSAELY